MFKLSSSRRWIACLFAGAFCAAVWAPARADEQADRIQVLEQRLSRSLQMIEQLASRVAELERERAPRPAQPSASSARTAPTATIEEQGKSIAALQESVNQIADGLSKNANDAGTPLHGFIDVGAGWSTRDDPSPLRGFNAGSLDLYLTSQIGPRVKSLIELVVEFDEEGSSVDMERVQIGYTFSDAFTLWAGRFHTPFGLWNTSFHHGANLQTSISRPKFVAFEDRGGLIAAHSVGLWASGKTRLGPGRLTYDGYVANGPRIHERSLDPNTFTDDNNDKMVGFNLGYQAAGALSGLTVGLHGFRSNVAAYTDAGALQNTTRLRALGGYFGYDLHDWEAFGEYYHFRNSDVADGVNHSSHAGFIHLGRSFGPWTPFARYERTSLAPEDNYFRSLRSGRPYRHVVFGARYALDANASVKLELRQSREAAATQIDGAGMLVDVPEATYRRALLQYSIAF